MPVETQLEQYSCDYCKRRKLRCSREVPKCNNCQVLDTCLYSRHGRLRRRQRAGSSVPSKNCSIAGPDNTPNQKEAAPGKLLDDDYGRQMYLGPSPMSSFLSQANQNIGQLKEKFLDTTFEANAEGSLSDLSKSFAAVHFNDSANVRSNVRSFRQSIEVFFIPQKEEGMQMIESKISSSKSVALSDARLVSSIASSNILKHKALVFNAGIDKGKPLFVGPPPDLLPKIIFEPSTVRERSWVLLVNAYLSTALSFIPSPDARLNRGVHWNTWLLLDDASIFLEPSEVSIQALMLVATHSQEIATPNLCWTLVSQACQMAQSLALHLPTRNAPEGSAANSRRNCLFWSLFILEKTVSLSFGRPALLPGYLYKNVPQIDETLLAQYAPHKKRGTPSNDKFSDSYGAFHVMRSKELADIQGDIQDQFYREGRSGNTKIDNLKLRLDSWMNTINQSASRFENSAVDPDERAAVLLGLNNYRFQYHHLTVYLTKGDKSNHGTSLSAARSAVSMLDKLVSNSIQVFNGIVWQMLYQPFTPYFVIFANIISDPHSSDCFSDLQLLRKVVLYFLQMHNNHQSARRLEKVAETFTKLAEAYVRQSMQESQEAPSETDSDGTVNSIGQLHVPAASLTNMTPSLREPLHSGVISPLHHQPAATDFLNPSQSFFEDPGLDPMALLNLFSPFDSNSSSSTGITPGSTGWQLQDSEFQQSLLVDGNLDWAPTPLIRGIEHMAQNYAFEGDFDWCSWDQSAGPY